MIKEHDRVVLKKSIPGARTEDGRCRYSDTRLQERGSI
jgi:hypothetical protein